MSSPVDWLAWIYEKLFVDLHPAVGYSIAAFLGAGFMCLLWFRAIDTYREKHPPAPPATSIVQSTPAPLATAPAPVPPPAPAETKPTPKPKTALPSATQPEPQTPPKFFGKLTEAQCKELAEYMKKSDALLKLMVRDHISEYSRSIASLLTTEIADWIENNIGPAQKQAFMGAEPWPYVYNGMPSTHGGIYQHLHGRLSYLSKLADKYCG